MGEKRFRKRPEEDICLNNVTSHFLNVMLQQGSLLSSQLCSEGLSLIQREVWTLQLFLCSSSLNPRVVFSDKVWLKVSKIDTEKSAFIFVKVLGQPDMMQTIWFRVKSLGHLSNVIQDGGFGHAVSAAPLEWCEPEISCMDSQTCLRGGAPIKPLDTEPGVSSRVCKCSLQAHWCWEHKAAHDTLGRGNQKFHTHTVFDSALCAFFPGQFFLIN